MANFHVARVNGRLVVPQLELAAGGALITSTHVQFKATAAAGSSLAVAILSNIGGVDGPASQTQVGWLKFAESSGGAAYVPYFK